MPITRNLLVIMDAYVKSYEDVPDEAQLELINNIRKFCKGSIQLIDEFGIEPNRSQEWLIKECEKLHR